jgi:hypothetical protein
MVKYLDGVQTIENNIAEFKVVGSGTVTVGTNQYPFTADILRPAKLYRNYILVVNNNSGQTINNVEVQGRTINANDVLPGSPAGTIVRLKSSSSLSNGLNTIIGVADLTSEEPNPFAVGNCRVQFNLATVPTSGTITWALIGY